MLRPTARSIASLLRWDRMHMIVRLIAARLQGLLRRLCRDQTIAPAADQILSPRLNQSFTYLEIISGLEELQQRSLRFAFGQVPSDLDFLLRKGIDSRVVKCRRDVTGHLHKGKNIGRAYQVHTCADHHRPCFVTRLAIIEREFLTRSERKHFGVSFVCRSESPRGTNYPFPSPGASPASNHQSLLGWLFFWNSMNSWSARLISPRSTVTRVSRPVNSNGHW